MPTTKTYNESAILKKKNILSTAGLDVILSPVPRKFFFFTFNRALLEDLQDQWKNCPELENTSVISGTNQQNVP
jgi:hypothetical protein